MRERTPELTEALERIDAWFETHHPDGLAALRPGVAEPSLSARADDLPTLPDEARALYRWHDGSADGLELFPGYTFLPLAAAEASYRLQREIARSVASAEPAADEVWASSWWPLFELESDFYTLDVESGRVLWCSNEDTPVALYADLAVFAAATAACFEAGVFRVSDSPSAGRVLLEEDAQASERLLERYRLEQPHPPDIDVTDDHHLLYRQAKERFERWFEGEAFPPFPASDREWQAFSTLLQRAREEVSAEDDGGRREVQETLDGRRRERRFDAEGRLVEQRDWLGGSLLAVLSRSYHEGGRVRVRQESFFGEHRVVETEGVLDEHGDFRAVDAGG